MSFEQTRFTLMAFPQKVDETGQLSLNIVFIPRNINPLKGVKTKFAIAPATTATAFADLKPEFDIRVVHNPNEFPGKILANEKSFPTVNPIEYSHLTKDIYTTLKNAKDSNGKLLFFDIDEARSSDVASGAKHRAPKPELDRNATIRKYLPISYQKAFNFTAPRIANAVTDDSYHCAMRDQSSGKKTLVKDDKVSWGKVYAHLMRQPLLAQQAGLIYQTTIQINFDDLQKGGWIYVDLKKNSPYYKEQKASLSDAEGPFIKRYAARLPMLKKGEKRNLFAPILFPVMKVGESPIGVYDELFIETAKFNDGFADIVHANQPVSGNLLQEEQDGFHPQKEAGIRLGWEDEQILIWYLRQMAVEEGSTQRIDAPLGITGYGIDARDNPANPWDSLTAVTSKGVMMLDKIKLGNFKGEMPFQVYPSKVYDANANNSNYWLPMYFANWNNQSLVLPDKVAAEIYQNDKEKKSPTTLNDSYTAGNIKTKLTYGHEYEFRVRFKDLSGGGPSADDAPTNPPSSHIAKTRFKRYVAPNAVTILNDSSDLITNTDDHNFTGSSLQLSRPLLGYPTVVYTDKYTDVINKLKQSVDDVIAGQKINAANSARAFGIPDPDVVSVEIKVEVETVAMDNLLSDDGREHFITIYTTKVPFNAFDENSPDGHINIPIEFKDIAVLDLTVKGSPYPEASDNPDPENHTGAIVLPTGRNVRMTLRAVGETKPNYWGVENLTNSKLDSRFGKSTVLTLRQETEVEAPILVPTAQTPVLQAIYLQPDPLLLALDPIVNKTLQGGKEGLPDIVQRLGDQLDVVTNGLTLTAPNGERIQFWCSNKIRHSLSPDNSSITFANKNELQHHWLVCTTLKIDRDWTWDSLDGSSFDILRKRRNGRDLKSLAEINFNFIGDIEHKRTASFQAIQPGKDKKVHREFTRIVILDVIEGTPPSGSNPDVIEVQYAVKPKFRNGHHPISDDGYQTENVILPVTTNPSQTPKLISAGIALSPYNRNEKYSATEVRTRFLWLEFEKEAGLASFDSIFCRVLSSSPDQLISNNHPSLLEIPTESPLSIDPEYTRVVTPDSSQDHNGLLAMQSMVKSTEADRDFYLLPIPPGLHHESPELFGMFTYEFRYGHTDQIWSTAQGRFGRPLRVAGLQHPAPSLNCMVNRNELSIQVNAPYALAVHNGKNVTSSPPNTSIWALIYAQVRQADGLDYRNILLGEQELKPIPKRNEKDMLKELLVEETRNIKAQKKKGVVLTSIGQEALMVNAQQQIALEKERIRHGFVKWRNSEVEEMLELYGLPLDSPLSVICVEVYRPITNISEHIDDFNRNKEELINKSATVFNKSFSEKLESELDGFFETPPRAPMDPLNSQLGLFRILRTSPLTEVPFICCVD